MFIDTLYNNIEGDEITHYYHENVHLLANTYLLALLAEVCHPDTTQPLLSKLIGMLYFHMGGVVFNKEYPQEIVKVPTKMTTGICRHTYNGLGFCSGQDSIIVNLIRAGNVPAQTIFDMLNYLVGFTSMDYLMLNRTENDSREITGCKITGVKLVRNSVEDNILFIPDPMGATGSTILETIKYYKENTHGEPLKIIAMHLIVTPEYIQRMKKEARDVIIYAARLDRGLSDESVYASAPGYFPDKEKGLNEYGYIIPGAGGMGELLSNASI
jgi:uracil phosphoribosyltransferase